MDSAAYVGTELELFAVAEHWKRYFGNKIAQRLGERVLEVGAGLAETTPWLCQGAHQTWICLEPDTDMCERIASKILTNHLPTFCKAYNGTTDSICDQGFEFDSILYIDVLEHISDDRAELRRAASLLSMNGEIIILAPAHDFLFSDFDAEIGHFRRYNKKNLEQACSGVLNIQSLNYLDSVGMLASLANRWLLGQPVPTKRQILFWDNFMVRASKFFDPLFGHAVGKSLLAVLRPMR